MTGVEFVDQLPPDRRGNARIRAEFRAVLDELRGRPGVWAVIRRCEKQSQAVNHSRHIRTHYPDFESVMRTVGDGDAREYIVYARFVGANGGQP